MSDGMLNFYRVTWSNIEMGVERWSLEAVEREFDASIHTLFQNITTPL